MHLPHMLSSVQLHVHVQTRVCMKLTGPVFQSHVRLCARNYWSCPPKSCARTDTCVHETQWSCPPKSCAPVCMESLVLSSKVMCACVHGISGPVLQIHVRLCA